ncbi:MAG: UvrD-helicase domain-containing protein [Acidobacteriota bacterium]
MSVQRFNTSQEQALDTSHHVAITAAAGSGKTTVLIERFLRILGKNGFRPGKIVSITFTEEAAAQMAERIRQAVELRGRSSPDTRWQRVRPLLPLARITTIHGFCLSLLRDYPLEAGLDPGFRVLSPTDQQIQLSLCVTQSLRELSRSHHPALKDALEYTSRRRLGPLLRQLVESRNYFQTIATNDLDLKILSRIYGRETASMALRSHAWDRLARILSEAPSALLEGDDSCARRCRAQRALLRHRGEWPEEEFLSRFRETFSMRIRPPKRWRTSPLYPELKVLWDSLKKVLKRHPLEPSAVTPRQEHHFRKAVASLGALYEEIRQRYQRSKLDTNALDFEDLLKQAHELVRRSSVRASLRSRYRYFLVDEFQDTNSLQWEILKPLIGTRANFFAVGDVKQSIYRFRNADVAVFQEVQTWVGRRGRVVNMPQNYRSLGKLVAFNNRVFSRLFDPALEYEAPHQEMQVCRLEEGGGGQIAAFFYDDPKEVGLCEPRLTAAWVKWLTERGGRQSGDIAILLRTRTRLREYETALRECGVPFQTVGGIGFYQRQEVLDLVNLLRFLRDRDNDVALAGVLRSPLFSFSDEDLFHLSTSGGEGLWGKLCGATSSEASTPSHWSFAAGLLQGWWSVRKRFTVAELLHKVLRETGYLHILSASRRGRQNVANVRKFVERIRDLERSGRRSLRELVRVVDTLIQTEPGEAESALVRDRARGVRIYTIHGAKGLQFPVVILPELGAPLCPGPRDRFLCETLKEGGKAVTYFGLRIRDPENAYSELCHPAYRMLLKLDEYRQMAEEKRLLFVATTRACDHLVLIGRRARSASYAGWLIDGGAGRHQVDQAFLSQLIEPVKRRLQTPERDAAEAGRISSDLGLRQLEEPTPNLGIPALPRALSFKDRMAEVKPRKRVWTPTEISLFALCPRKCYLSKVEGLPEEHPFDLQPIGHQAELLGSAIHEALESVTDLEGGSAVARLLETWRVRLSALFPKDDGEAILQEMSRHVQRVLKGPLYPRMKTARRLFSEKELNIRCGSHLITGVIDKLFQEAGGGWVVVDFKTNRIGPGEVERTARRAGYHRQVQLYLWAVSQILDTGAVRGFLFFTHTGDQLELQLTDAVVGDCRELIERLPVNLDRDSFVKTDDPSLCVACGFLRQGICSGVRSHRDLVGVTAAVTPAGRLAGQATSREGRGLLPPSGE